MEPMLSAETSSAAEALKQSPRKGGSAPGPFSSRMAAWKGSGIVLEQS